MQKAIVIGAGPAGLSAAIYLAKANVEPLVIKGVTPSKYLMTTMEIDAYPGFPLGVNGPSLLDDMSKQAEYFGARIRTGSVKSADLSKRPFLILTTGHGSIEIEPIETESIVIATGASFKSLNIPGETANFGRGVSTCATCTGYFASEKKVVVIGGGDSALEEALYLTRYASEITIVHRRNELRASKGMQERARQSKQIKWMLDVTPLEILDDGHQVSGLKVRENRTGLETVVPAERVYVAIGSTPNAVFLDGQLPVGRRGHLMVKPGTTETDIPGIFACGDVQDDRYGQIASAVGSGCMAAGDCERYLEGLQG
ncbi:thioredoxin-disulfide reductase [Cohnella endophytica]|uniref:Thioredoxin-disulfide reductase n=1 Tax=Cohnella endophytica TaxID=2419778 RepID=A0A494XPT1_9BACL|nr:FAD-dependent oxidoreductase [Cohnella endophytica]RKP50159.1 thioredoxin-disulfide reductase [Cohnella endophytica]